MPFYLESAGWPGCAGGCQQRVMEHSVAALPDNSAAAVVVAEPH